MRDNQGEKKILTMTLKNLKVEKKKTEEEVPGLTDCYPNGKFLSTNKNNSI
jgi:hypothetical protein